MAAQPPNNSFANDGAIRNINVQNGKYVAPIYAKGSFDLSTSNCAENDSNYLASLMSESLNIAAGPVNVFPMLGIHNQGSTLDQPGNGNPIDGGSAASGYSVANVFSTLPSLGWRSIQTGTAVTTSAYVGYDFGTKKAWNNTTERYYPVAPVRLQISPLKIKQSADPTMRAIQIRVEASDDGITWQRVDVVSVQNTTQLVTIGIRSVAPFRMWRLIP